MKKHGFVMRHSPALTPVAADERCYERVLPAMGELVRNNQRVSVTLGFAPAIRAEIKKASPAVQKLADRDS